MMTISRFLPIFTLGMLFIFTQTVFAKDLISTGFLSNTALKGYDSVAYFTQNKAVKGSKKFSYDYKGATWRFSSQENLETFKTNPSKYEPQYGGYCAYAASLNQVAPSDPKVFALHNGKLYLNYNKKVHGLWEGDKQQSILNADKNWPSLIK